MELEFENKTFFGILFTALSIIGSFIGVSINWYQDRQLEYAVQSAQIRELSIKAYSNILYWNDLNDHFYREAEELIEEVATAFRNSGEHVETRDVYWRGITNLRNKVDYEILQRELKTYHLKLLSYNLDNDSTFIKSVTIIDKMLEMNFKDYIQESQAVILSQDMSTAGQTAILGNKLRTVNRKFREKDRELFKKQFSKLDIYLQNITNTSDKELLGF